MVAPGSRASRAEITDPRLAPVAGYFVNCETLQIVGQSLAAPGRGDREWASFEMTPAIMKTNDKNLQCKVEALDSLLADPRVEDCEWFDQLLVALEQVAEYSLNPGIPVRALSRTLRAIPQTSI